MAIDAYHTPVPAEQKVFARQNLFSGIYKPPIHDNIGVNLYQDFSYSWVGSQGYFAMATGLNVVLNHVFEFGPFCNYFLENVTIDNSDLSNNSLILSSYFYCGNMLAYVPIANKMFHPKIWLDVGLGNAQGVARNNTLNVQSDVSYVFVVLKPAIAVEVNLFSFLQWTAAAQYRLQINVDGPSDDLGPKASGFELSTGPVIHF